jgi:hypothetical protein
MHSALAAFNQDDRPCVPCDRLAMAETVGAFEERFIEAGTAILDHAVVPQQILSTPQFHPIGPVKERLRKPCRDFLR